MNDRFTVLFFDDDLAVLNAYKRRFRKSDLLCLYISTTKELLKLAKDNNIDLLISDIQIPDTKIDELLIYYNKVNNHSEIILLTADINAQVINKIKQTLKIRKVISKNDNPVEKILLEINLMLNKNNSSIGNQVILDRDIESLIPNFLLERKLQCKIAQKELKSENYYEIGQIGHKLKGVGRLYGFDKISFIGEKIENSAYKKDSNKIKNDLEELIFYLENVQYRFNE